MESESLEDVKKIPKHHPINSIIMKVSTLLPLFFTLQHHSHHASLITLGGAHFTINSYVF